jgi:hypothetical protein
VIYPPSCHYCPRSGDIHDDLVTDPARPRRAPVCAECARDHGLTDAPVALTSDLHALISAGTCWCGLAHGTAPRLSVLWCPAHGHALDLAQFGQT